MTSAQVRNMECDPVFQVTGVPAREVLARIAAVRVETTTADLLRCGPGAVFAAASPARVRLLDLADGTNEDFVQRVHQVLLGRGATDPERQRRLAELAAGGSRMELVVRLALCEEGRRRRSHPVSGLGLPALIGLGHRVERLAGRPALAAWGDRVVPVARVAVSARARRTTGLALRAGAVAAGVTAASWRRRRVQATIGALSQELELLRREVRA